MDGRKHAKCFMPPNIKGSYRFDVFFLVMCTLVSGFIHRLLKARICFHVAFGSLQPDNMGNRERHHDGDLRKM